MIVTTIREEWNKICEEMDGTRNPIATEGLYPPLVSADFDQNAWSTP